MDLHYRVRDDITRLDYLYVPEGEVYIHSPFPKAARLTKDTACMVERAFADYIN